MQDLGATDAQIREYRESIKEPDLLILAENEQAVRWFSEVDDQFIRNGGFLIGLDINAIKADAELTGREVNPEQYRKLRYLGRRAAVYFNEARSRK